MPVLVRASDDDGALTDDVVVAQDGEAQRAGEGGEDLGTAVGGVVGGDEGERAVGDEVAGEQDEVGGEGVDLLTTCSRKKGSVYSSRWMSLSWTMRKPWKGRADWRWRWAVNDVDLVAGDLAGVEAPGLQR